MSKTSISVIKNFITVAEQRELTVYARDRWDVLRRRTRHRSAGMSGERRSRIVKDLPEWLQHRITNISGVTAIWRTKLVMHKPGGLTALHSDTQKPDPNDIARRANQLVKAADEGGIFQIEGMPIEIPERSLLLYDGDTQHEVTKVLRGDRIMITNFYVKDRCCSCLAL